MVHTNDGTVRLAELARAGEPLLLDFTEGVAFVDLAASLDTVRTVVGRADDSPAAALLVRPDGYLAWASDQPGDDADDRARLESALRRWFGGRAATQRTRDRAGTRTSPVPARPR